MIPHEFFYKGYKYSKTEYRYKNGDPVLQKHCFENIEEYTVFLESDESRELLKLFSRIKLK